MAVTAPLPAGSETGVIRVNYWAAARAAAGVAHDDVPTDGPMTLAEVLAAALERHPGTRLPDVVGVCSVLVGEQPVGTEHPGDVVVQPGAVVELLPPFAGG